MSTHFYNTTLLKTQSYRMLLNFDTAREIAQGLGAHLDALRHVGEIKGNTARLIGRSAHKRCVSRGGHAYSGLGF